MVLLFWGSVCIGLAAVVGGATGFGTALIAAPFMLLAGFKVEDVVIINLVAGVVTRIGVSLRLRAHIDWCRVTLLVGGSLPGATTIVRQEHQAARRVPPSQQRALNADANEGIAHADRPTDDHGRRVLSPAHRLAMAAQGDPPYGNRGTINVTAIVKECWRCTT